MKIELNKISQGSTLAKASLLFLLFLLGCGSSPIATTPISTAEIVAQVNSIVDANTKSNQAGIVVILRKNGNVIYKRAAGMADIENNIPLTTNTKFQIASTSKPFTAVAIMQLVDRKLLTLDDSIIKFLPELSIIWFPIKIRHLLSHQSGIPDYLTTDSVTNKVPWLNGLTNNDLLSFYVANQNLNFTPGTSSEYSSANFAMLAEIIGRASGMPFYQYMATQIFAPSSMTNSFIVNDPTHQNDSVALNFGKNVVPYGANMQTYGGIGQFSSAEDISSFATALFSGRLLSQNSFNEMLQARATFPVSNQTYGYGWYVGAVNGYKYIHHLGALDGYHSIVRFLVNNTDDVIILCNGGQFRAALQILAIVDKGL